MIGTFGEHLGCAFQIADDVIDVAIDSSTEQLGKKPGADLRDGTVTMPIALAAISNTHIRNSLEILYGEIADAQSDETRVAQIIAAIDTTSALMNHAHFCINSWPTSF